MRSPVRRPCSLVNWTVSLLGPKRTRTLLRSEQPKCGRQSEAQPHCATSLQCEVAHLSRRAPDVNPHLCAAYHEVPCPPATVFTFARCSPTKSVDLESNRSISTNMSPLNVEPCACSLPDLPDRPLVVKCTPVAFAMRCRYRCDQGESAETSEPGDLAHDLPKNSEHF